MVVRFPKSAVVLAVIGVGLRGGNAARGAPPSGSNYKLVFDDEFNSRTLDAMKWGYNYPWNAHEHTSQAYMGQSQVLLTGTNLDLQAVAVRNPGATDFNDPNFGWQVVNYTSGCINTSGKFNATTGYFEASIKMPQVTGTWPAFWMLQGGWPPEVDIVEYLNAGAGSTGNKQDHVTYHYTNSSGAASSYGNTYAASADLATGYHTYGFAWTSTSMNFYLDGTVVRRVTDATAIAQASNMYMLLENRVGGWAGTPAANSAFPADMLVDYVRVYQVNPNAIATTAWGSNAGGGSWDTAGNWSVQVPNYQDLVAVFGSSSSSGAVTVSWSNYRTVGGLPFNGNGSYVIGTSGGLSFSTSVGGPSIILTATNTSPQTIAARVDLAYSPTSNTLIENDSAQPLTISGVIAGGGDVTFEGVGTTVISNNNTYDGNTYVDAGNQGPAVVRVTRSRPFGTTGTVIFNTAGNSTSGRIELQDNREIPNNIQLSGRNNGTVALENISGTNTLSGTLSVLVGGGSYLIQSDDGLMVFSGASTNAAAGVAITSLASRTRTVTLQGTGGGLVSGVIANGSATLGIAKGGTGTWTLSGANTYSGPTTISAGAIRLGSSAGLGSTAGTTTIAAGATLDLNGQVTAEPITSVAGTGYDGNGAIVNTSGTPATLSGDVTAAASFSLGGPGVITFGKVVASGQTLTKVGTGTATLGGPLSAGSLVVSGGKLVLAVPVTSGTPSVTATLSGVSISGGASLVLPSVNRPTVGRRLLVVSTLDLTSNAGRLDLGNGDAIYGTRPWKMQGEGKVRFTTKADALYAICLGNPGSEVSIAALGESGGKVNGVTLLGSDARLDFAQDSAGMKMRLPAALPSETAVTLRISGIVGK